MNRFYKGYDGIAASDAFKSRMVHSLQNEAKKTAPERSGGFVIKKRTLAILIAAVVAVLAIGTAAAATIIANSYRSPSEYMMQTQQEREQNQSAVQDIENAIASAKPESGKTSVVMLPEMDNADELNEWRQKMGQPVYSEQDWGWIREIRPEIEEVLMDESTVVFNVRLNTDHGLYFDNFKTDGPKTDAICDDAWYSLDGQDVHTMGSGGTGILPGSVTPNGATLSTECNLDTLSEPFPTEGKVHMTMQIGIRDSNVDSMSSAGLLAILTYSFEFDASAGGDVAAPVVTERALSGSIVLTEEDAEGREFNTRVSLDGVVLEETLHFRNTGVYVRYTVKSAPNGWTDRETRALLQPCFGSPSHYGLNVVCAPKGSSDSDSILNPGYPTVSPADEYIGILPIFPSDYETVKAAGYEIRIGFRCVTAFNDQPVGEDWHIPPEAGVDYSYDLLTTEQPITAFELILP